MQQPLPRIDLLAPQADQFRDTQPVPIGQQDHRGIAVISRSISARVRCSRLRRAAFGCFGGGVIARLTRK